MANEKYLIYYNETSTSKKYVEYIQRNSCQHDTDMGDAIEFDDKDTALKVAEYLNKRQHSYKYLVMCIKTSIEEVVE